MKYIISILLLILFYCTSLWSDSNTVQINEDKIYYFNSRLGFIEDKTQKLSIDDILSKSFEKTFEVQVSEDTETSFGFSNSNYWLKFTLVNNLYTNDFYINIKYPLLDQIEVYEVKSDQSYKVYKFGDTVKFHERIVFNRNFLIPIQLESTKEVTFYIKVKSSSSIQIPLEVYSNTLFYKLNQRELFGYGIYYGILFIVFLYNLLLYISIKDRLYILFIVHIVCFVFWQSAIDGFGFQFLWYNYPDLNNISIPLGLSFLTVSSLIYAYYFLNIEFKINAVNIIYILMIFSSILTAIFSLTLDYSFSIRYSTINGVIASFVLFQFILSKMQKEKREFRAAWFYFIAWTSFLSGGLILSLNKWGILPRNFFTEHAQQIGSVIEVVLLSLALADRIRLVREEKEMAEKELLDNRMKNLEFFSLFVPRQFLKFLQKESIFEIKLGDAVKYRMAILASDIRDFTALSEKMDPENNFKFINSYFNIMAKVVHDNGGFIDKYIGDAIIAFFPDNPENAIHAAIKMQEELYIFNKERIRNTKSPIRVGIGVHYGDVILGTVGTSLRTDTTVLGESIVIANFVENLTKKYGQPILFTETIVQQVPADFGINFEVVDKILFKEDESPISIYKIYGNRLIDIITSPRLRTMI